MVVALLVVAVGHVTRECFAYRRRRLAVRVRPIRARAEVPGVGMAVRLKTTSL
jgi:hypothetical protein